MKPVRILRLTTVRASFKTTAQPKNVSALESLQTRLVCNAWLNVLQGVLTVVDVYNDWAGPCMAMASFLKKIRLEVR